MFTLERYKDWQGSIGDLVKVSHEVLKLLGRAELPAPNVRLIRDYAQRGIISQSDRRGKEAHYNIQHLQELVAARILVSEGMPLAKIAEQFQRDRDIVIVTLGLPASGEHIENSAMAKWRDLGQPKFSKARRSNKDNFEERQASAMFMRQAIADTGQKMDLRSRLSSLGSKSGEPKVDRLVRVQLTDWCWVLIDAKKLRSLSMKEAEDIGQAISTALIDPRIKRGESP